MTQQSFGVIGLAVMGENLALNVERNGFPIAVYNRTPEKTDAFMHTRAQDRNVKAAYSIEEFVKAMMNDRNLSMFLWGQASMTTVYV